MVLVFPPKVFNIKGISDLVLVHPLLAIDAWTRLFLTLAEVEERGDRKINENDEEKDKGKEGHPFIASKLRDFYHGLRQRQGAKISRKLNLKQPIKGLTSLYRLLVMDIIVNMYNWYNIAESC